MLRRTTTCAVRHGSTYDIPHDGTASEQYAGEVVVDRRPSPSTPRRLHLPPHLARHRRTGQPRRCGVDVGAEGYDVTIDVEAYDGDEQVSHREWTEHVPR